MKYNKLLHAYLPGMRACMHVICQNLFLSLTYAYMMHAIRAMTYFQVQQSTAEPELDSMA